MNTDDAPAFLAAAARVPAGQFSAPALAALAALAAAGHAQAQALITQNDHARRAAAGPLPARNPFTHAALKDALRRYAAHNWPRLSAPPAPALYRLTTQDGFAAALTYLSRSRPDVFITLTLLKAHHSDAPGGYEYQHPDPAALYAALEHLSRALWIIERRAARTRKGTRRHD